MSHDAELECVYDDRGARVVVRRADDEIWISDELWEAARDPDRAHIAGDLEVDGNLIQFGTEGEGLGRLTYRKIGRGEHWRIAKREFRL